MTDRVRWAAGRYTRCWVAVVCGLVVLGLAASGSAAVNALVVGELRACYPAGPSDVSPCSPRKRAVVSAFDARHRLVAKEAVTNAHFSFLLKPGHYMIRVASRHLRAHRPVIAKAHHTVHANIDLLNLGP
jgi:hypothetical protein